jgi:hypothetical protein
MKVTEDQKEALRELLRVAQGLDPAKINMGHWAERHTCGTSACLMGHAAMDPWFMDQDWSIRWASPNLKGMLCFETENAGPEERILFFGLDDIEAGPLESAWDDYLFMPTSYAQHHTGGQKLKDEIIEHVTTACECAGAISPRVIDFTDVT